MESSGYSSRRSSAGKGRPPALQSKISKKQSQSSISFQEGIVEIPLGSESQLVSQSEDITTTADQSEGFTADSQSEFTIENTNNQSGEEIGITDQSEERNGIIDQSEATYGVDVTSDPNAGSEL